jgi:hypothetical protein
VDRKAAGSECHLEHIEDKVLMIQGKSKGWGERASETEKGLTTKETEKHAEGRGNFQLYRSTEMSTAISQIMLMQSSLNLGL